MTFMDLIKSKKKACATGGFAVFDVSRSDQTAYILSTDQSLSSTSGALLIFTVKSTMNYTCILWPSKKKKKKKKKKANNKTQIRPIRCRCMQRLIRTYTVWELIYQI